jgi:hypothetical protein
MYGNDNGYKFTKEKDSKNSRWFLIWFFSSIITAFVAYVSLTNANIKKIHPSQLIGAMAVLFLLVNWHVFIWKIGEVDVVCYVKADQWFIYLVGLFGGKMTSE